MVFLSRAIAVLILATASTNAAPTDAASTTGGARKHSSNYAGGVIYGEDIVEVNADITISTCTVGLPRRDFNQYTSDGWIGLGAYARRGLIQAGVTCHVDVSSPATYSVWTEWAPDPPVFYNSTDLQPGDVIHARVVAHSKTSGATYLENRRTGEKFETSYTNQTNELNLGDVEWVTESQLEIGMFGPEGSLGARYTPWRFQNATYKTGDQKIFSFDSSNPNAHLIDTILEDVQIATAYSNNSGSLEVAYTTPNNYTIPGLS
ncbi:hypothetical protein EKO04_011223 [Ascochyta lentis]|uniref:Concanavalin A-like lectin/glucanase n=1 Tax=Ascochyta lentis TaxID=205686 RepID=A0A8H7ITE2_9PLEO|nr:hypothetical protein EKO04_011223 [Ascochyta lentis]